MGNDIEVSLGKGPVKVVAGEVKPKAKATRKPKAKAKATRKPKRGAVTIVNGGFRKRSEKPVVTGKGDLKSRMMRVEVGLADYMRKEAMRAGASITDVQRNIHQGLLA